MMMLIFLVLMFSAGVLVLGARVGFIVDVVSFSEVVAVAVVDFVVG